MNGKIIKNSGTLEKLAEKVSEEASCSAYEVANNLNEFTSESEMEDGSLNSNSSAKKKQKPIENEDSSEEDSLNDDTTSESDMDDQSLILGKSLNTNGSDSKNNREIDNAVTDQSFT